MAEPAAPARKPAEPAASAKAPAAAAPGGHAELLSGRSETLAGYVQRLAPRGETALGRCAQLLARGAAARAPTAPVPAAGPRPVQAMPNRTGLPDRLKAGVEALSGHSMDDVRVHRNSAEPAKLGALAHARGNEIHLGPGQDRHLPHEAWHVAQQKQGRVAATRTLAAGVAVNDDPGLEHEADVMGARAAAGAGDRAAARVSARPAGAGPVQRMGDDAVFQLVLATVNPQNGPVTLDQVGGGGHFVIMQNLGQPAGAAVSNVVGFTGVLNPAGWAGLAKASATNYWRAHGYAESFGGAGDATNVGWWQEASEAQWTDYEQKVRGAGLAQIPAWLPGIGEQGTYLVEREMHPATLFKQKYIDTLEQAVLWGFADARPAWQRTLQTCDDLFGKEKGKRLAALRTEKLRVQGLIAGRIGNWVNALFGVTNLETNLIKKMKMTYTRNPVGAGAGPERKNISKSISSARPRPADFGLLTDKKAELWAELLNHNQGMFMQAGPPLPTLVGAVPYEEVGRPAQQLAPYADGWGSP